MNNNESSLAENETQSSFSKTLSREEKFHPQNSNVYIYIEFCGFTRICKFLQQRTAATINLTTCGWKQLTVKGKPKNLYFKVLHYTETLSEGLP